MSLENQLAELAEGTGGDRPIVLQLGGHGVPVRFKRAEGSRTLIVIFHGAVDRAKRAPPIFNPFLPPAGSQAHQLSISDPALLRPGAFSLAWYAGYSGFPLQRLLPDLLRSLIERLGVERVIFFGSSGGGFAALYFSWHFSGSLALASVPQTRLDAYYVQHLRNYREGCWPEVASMEELSCQICTDVCGLYAQVVPNTVIYLQSAGDRFHLQNHALPFASAITSVKDSRFVLDYGFWGRLGHSGAVTPEGYMPWLLAALTAPSWEVNDLLATRHALSGQVPVAPRLAVHGGAKPNPGDLRMADLLRDLQLNS